MRMSFEERGTGTALSACKPYTPILVANANDLSVATELPETRYGLAYTIEGSCTDERIKVIETLIRGDHSFMLVINKNTCLQDDHIIDLIILCLFSKNYIHVGTSPVIAFLYKDATEHTAWGNLFSEVLLSKLTAQGWPAIKLWHVYEWSLSQQIDQKAASPLFLEQVDVDENYLEKNYFFNFRYVGEYVFFKRNSLQAAIELEKYFSSMCNAILSNTPLLKEGLQEYLSLKRKYLEQQVENSVLEERLHNAEITIEVIRSKYKDDYEQLIKWYHNEYEILPLWYKRFGHIIKVLTGKRTFKSLFFDHVKKYK